MTESSIISEGSRERERQDWLIEGLIYGPSWSERKIVSGGSGHVGREWWRRRRWTDCVKGGGGEVARRRRPRLHWLWSISQDEHTSMDLEE